MTHMILPQMIERGKGAIVIMASSCSETPAAELAVYGATKVRKNLTQAFDCSRFVCRMVIL